MKYQHAQVNIWTKQTILQRINFGFQSWHTYVVVGNGSATYDHLTPVWTSVSICNWQHVKCWNEGTQQLHGKTHAGRWPQEHHFFTWTSFFHTCLGDLYLLKSMQNAWQSANAAAKLLPGLPAGMLLVEPQEPNWKQQLGALTPSNNWSCIYELAFRNQNWLWKITLSSVHIRYVSTLSV